MFKTVFFLILITHLLLFIVQFEHNFWVVDLQLKEFKYASFRKEVFK